jgi:hypothetical protein
MLLHYLKANWEALSGAWSMGNYQWVLVRMTVVFGRLHEAFRLLYISFIALHANSTCVKCQPIDNQPRRLPNGIILHCHRD